MQPKVAFFGEIPSGLITPRMGEEEVGVFLGGKKKSLGLIFTPHGEGFFWEGKFPPPFDKYGMPQGLF